MMPDSVFVRLVALAFALCTVGTALRSSASGRRRARKAGQGRPAPVLRGSVKARYVKLYRKGNMLLYQGHYIPAVAHFQAAIKLAPHVPGAWRQLGLAREGLKEHPAAIKAYEKYLELAGTGGMYARKVMRRINACLIKLGMPPRQFKELQEGKPGAIRIECNVDGALIHVDNIGRGSTPTPPLPISPGLHTVMLSKTGYLPWSTTLSVEAGRTHSLEVRLKVDPNFRGATRPRKFVETAPTPDTAFLTVATNVSGYELKANGVPVPRTREGHYELRPGDYTLEISAPGRARVKVRVKLARGQKKTVKVRLFDLRKKRKLRLWAWVSLGVAAALCGTGAVFGGLENHIYEKVRDRSVSDRRELTDLARKGKRYRTIAYSFYGAAGAAFAASAVLFILQRRGEARPDATPPFALGPAGKGGISLIYSRKVDF